MQREPTYVGIDVAKEMLDVALRPGGRALAGGPRRGRAGALRGGRAAAAAAAQRRPDPDPAPAARRGVASWSGCGSPKASG